jgi:hypothetical protein
VIAGLVVAPHAGPLAAIAVGAAAAVVSGLFHLRHQGKVWLRWDRRVP